MVTIVPCLMSSAISSLALTPIRLANSPTVIESLIRMIRLMALVIVGSVALFCFTCLPPRFFLAPKRPGSKTSPDALFSKRVHPARQRIHHCADLFYVFCWCALLFQGGVAQLEQSAQTSTRLRAGLGASLRSVVRDVQSVRTAWSSRPF